MLVLTLFLFIGFFFVGILFVLVSELSKKKKHIQRPSFNTIKKPAKRGDFSTLIAGIDREHSAKTFNQNSNY